MTLYRYEKYVVKFLIVTGRLSLQNRHMVKAFRYFKKPDGGIQRVDLRKGDNKLHKYSIYMQSKDSGWLNRNINGSNDDEPEPIEEDIRD